MTRWKITGKINAIADPDKLEINAIKSAKCGIKIAGSRVRKLVETRMPINQTRSGILQENESGETDSSIVCIIVITQKGYEKIAFKSKNAFTRLRITPTGRLFTITSWILELKDKNAHTEKTTFTIATKKYERASIVRYLDLFSMLASTPGKTGWHT